MTTAWDTVVLTGATSGIGAAVAARLAPVTRRLVLLGPEHEDTMTGMLTPLRAASAGSVEYLSADFSRLAAVEEVAARIATGGPVSVLVNDAGIPGAESRRTTVDGNERTLQINFLALVLLTERLRGVLGADGRIVNLASATHSMTDLDLADIQLERGYTAVRAYARSKLAIILYTRWLARQHPAGPVAVSLQPGVISTGLLHAMFGDIGGSVDEGAAAVLAAMTAPARGGEYFDGTRLAMPSTEARDDALGDRLMDWTLAALP